MILFNINTTIYIKNNEPTTSNNLSKNCSFAKWKNVGTKELLGVLSIKKWTSFVHLMKAMGPIEDLQEYGDMGLQRCE